MRTFVTSVMIVFVAAVLAACGDTGSDGQPTDEPDEQSTNPDDVDNEAGDFPPSDPGFDRDAATERAEALLGTPEGELDENPELRIVRRGDEEFPGTMDLRPGRNNLELDEVDGAMVVTRVVVEVPDGEDPIDVQLDG